MKRYPLGNILHKRAYRILKSEQTEQNGKETAETRQAKDL